MRRAVLGLTWLVAAGSAVLALQNVRAGAFPLAWLALFGALLWCGVALMVRTEWTEGAPPTAAARSRHVPSKRRATASAGTFRARRALRRFSLLSARLP